MIVGPLSQNKFVKLIKDNRNKYLDVINKSLCC